MHEGEKKAEQISDKAEEIKDDVKDCADDLKCAAKRGEAKAEINHRVSKLWNRNDLNTTTLFTNSMSINIFYSVLTFQLCTNI